MAFTINLYRTNAARNKVDKGLSSLISVSGELKDESSILDPVILLHESISTVVHANYMYIESFSRYYFITDIKTVRNNLIEIYAHVDVLMSYASQIRDLTCIIYRQENDWNLYLDDGSFQVYNNPNVLTRPFPSGFTRLNYVLAVAGAINTPSGI